MLTISKTKTLTMLTSVMLLALIVLAPMASRKQGDGVLDPEEQFTKLIHSVEGPDLFRSYCASCHGPDAKGSKPDASSAKTKAPDLTLLAQKNDGTFPANYVHQMISGDVEVLG